MRIFREKHVYNSQYIPFWCLVAHFGVRKKAALPYEGHQSALYISISLINIHFSMTKVDVHSIIVYLVTERTLYVPGDFIKNDYRSIEKRRRVKQETQRRRIMHCLEL